MLLQVPHKRTLTSQCHPTIPEKPEKISEALKDKVQAALVLDLPAGTYRAEWIDTKTGSTVGNEQFQHNGGEKPLQSPAFVGDIALRVKAK